MTVLKRKRSGNGMKILDWRACYKKDLPAERVVYIFWIKTFTTRKKSKEEKNTNVAYKICNSLLHSCWTDYIISAHVYFKKFKGCDLEKILIIRCAWSDASSN